MEDASKFEEEEDIHICGSCGAQFSDVEYFISHKKHSCPVRLARQHSGPTQVQQNGNKIKEHTVDGRGSIDTVIQENVQPLVDNIQPSYGTETEQYMEAVGKDGEALAYLQQAPAQTGSQHTPEDNCAAQFVTQSEYVHTEGDGSNNSIAHEYVLLSGPEESYTGQDQTFDHQVTTETVYTLDSHTLQTGLTSITDQPMSTQVGNSYYQTSMIDQQPITVQSDLVQQPASNTLQINNSTILADTENQSALERAMAVNENQSALERAMAVNENQSALERAMAVNENQSALERAMAATENQSALERAMAANELDVNHSGITTTVPVQDGYVTSSDQNTEIHYTLSLDPQGRAQVSSMKVSETVTTGEYDARSHDHGQDIQGLKVGDIVKPGEYEQDIQYTLTTVPQSVDRSDDMIIIEQNVGAHIETRLESKLKAVKTKPVKTSASSPVKKSRANMEKKYKCTFPECQYKTAYMKDLERHTRIHTGEKPFKCSQCDKSFNRNDKLVLHMKYHLNERAFKCQLCDYCAVENGSLKKHMKVHLDERPFSCQVCPYKSRSASQLQIHLRTHTGDTPYSCGVCAAQFKVSSDLKRHLRTHTGEKPYLCQFTDCNYRCAIKSNLRSHYRTHHKEDQELSCDTCDFKTSSKKTLFEHKKSHNVKVDLICEHCNYQCSNRSALKNHLKMHCDTEEKHRCNYCKYTSVQSGNVQAHMKRKHPQKITRKIFKKCKLVNKFEDKIVQEESLEEKPVRSSVRTKCSQNFKCDHCSAAFVREDSLKCHIKQHKDCSLSTAYAVLKLQQPVINTSSCQATRAVGSGCLATGGVDAQSSNFVNSEMYLQDQNRGSILQTEEGKDSILFQDGSFHSQNQATSIQSQTVNLGINDILMAAGVSTLSSTGNSPTSKTPLYSSPLQDSPSAEGIVGNPSILSPNSSASDVHNVLLGQSANEVPSVQVMQNISLPYIRLPNGQVLILTGQNSLGQLVTQSENFGQFELTPGTGATQIPNQIFAQQPTTEQQQLIQSPADSTSPGAVVSQISSPQQPGAIPIQIILPNDSQQAMPLVTQLLNSVISRGAYDNQFGATAGQVTSTSPSKSQGTSGLQNLILQIPSQSGAAKDSDGSLTESQQFVLQISGQGNFN